MTVEQAASALCAYIRRQERAWGTINTPWGTLMVLTSEQIDPLVKNVEDALEEEARDKAQFIYVTAGPPVMIEKGAREEHRFRGVIR